MGALDQLYITGWAGNQFSSAQVARNLIDLATGATLGALCSAAPRPAMACLAVLCNRRASSSQSL